MQDERTLTQFFSNQQVKRFLASQGAKNGLFRIDEKSYGSEKTPFETASEGPSPSNMNGYASENSVFLFCKRLVLTEKNGSMLLGKELCQGHSTASCPKLSSRVRSRDLQEFI